RRCRAARTARTTRTRTTTARTTRARIKEGFAPADGRFGADADAGAHIGGSFGAADEGAGAYKRRVRGGRRGRGHGRGHGRGQRRRGRWCVVIAGVLVGAVCVLAGVAAGYVVARMSAAQLVA